MAHLNLTWLALIFVVTFRNCVLSLGNQNLWNEIFAQQTLKHQISQKKTSWHQTLQHDTSKQQTFKQDSFWYRILKHKTSWPEYLRHENFGHQPFGNQNLEHQTLRAETSGQESSRHKKSTGCTAPLLLPDKPFFVVWNHPTASCLAHGINLDFEKWGIVDNNKDSFVGEKIVMFYQLGQFPYYSGGNPHHGGIPQLGNLSSHLQQASIDINRNIPSPSFSGLSIIDFESWRPIFYLNYDALKIYKEKSLELARQRFPQYNKSQIVQEAVTEFQAAARLSWIYNISTGLYPSIYFLRGSSAAGRAAWIRNIIHETLRVKATWTSQDTVILPYALCQDSSLDLFNETDLSYSILQPADMGSSGVVLWGSSNYMKAKNECLVLQEYINITLGPYVLNVTSFFANCSQKLCTGHGRCVRKDYEQVYQYYLKKRGDSSCFIPDSVLARKNKKLKVKTNKSTANDIFRFNRERFSPHSDINQGLLKDDQREQLLSDFDDYVCKCFAGWYGNHCEHPTAT